MRPNICSQEITADIIGQILNISVFDKDGRFKSQGGFSKINKVFQNKLESIVLELNEYLYDDGGRSA